MLLERAILSVNMKPKGHVHLFILKLSQKEGKFYLIKNKKNLRKASNLILGDGRGGWITIKVNLGMDNTGSFK